MTRYIPDTFQIIGKISGMSGKFYAVARGRQVGVWQDWSFVKTLVQGYEKARYKGFATQEEALEFIERESGPIDKQVYDPNFHSLERAQQRSREQQKIIVYTDGSCSNKRGGYGIVIIHPDGNVKELHGRVEVTSCTNNIAELWAVMIALGELEDSNLPVEIYTDSKYVIGCLVTWTQGWIQNGWKTSQGRSPLNSGYIQRCLQLMERKKVIYTYVAAHQGNPLNERVDHLSNVGRMS